MTSQTSCGRMALALFLAVAPGCRSHGHLSTAGRSVLLASPGIPVAHIGGEAVTADEVRAVARDEGLIDPRAALDRAITLRLLAREAVRRGLDHDPIVSDIARRAAVQSLLMHTVEQQVRPDTLPRDALETWLRVRGFDLAHGELRRTFHVLVEVPSTATPAQRAALQARAETAHAAVSALASPRTVETFRAAAIGALTGLTPRLEDLPGIDAQGRYANGEMAAAYARATAGLERPGDVSEVVETPFGYHVILLVERLPALTRPDAEVRAIVGTELLWRLRHTALDEMLARLRSAHHATVRSQALERVGSLAIEPATNVQRGGS